MREIAYENGSIEFYCNGELSIIIINYLEKSFAVGHRPSSQSYTNLITSSGPKNLEKIFDRKCKVNSH